MKKCLKNWKLTYCWKFRLENGVILPENWRKIKFWAKSQACFRQDLAKTWTAPSIAIVEITAKVKNFVKSGFFDHVSGKFANENSSLRRQNWKNSVKSMKIHVFFVKLLIKVVDAFFVYRGRNRVIRQTQKKSKNAKMWRFHEIFGEFRVSNVKNTV